ALGSFARWDRPSAASRRTVGVQPGRFAQGPEEKHAFAGRTAGAVVVILCHPFRWAPLVGERCPAAAHSAIVEWRQAARCARLALSAAACDRGRRLGLAAWRRGTLAARASTHPRSSAHS